MNVLDFQKMKDEGRKISMVTSYDYSSARRGFKGSYPIISLEPLAIANRRRSSSVSSKQ